MGRGWKVEFLLLSIQRFMLPMYVTSGIQLQGNLLYLTSELDLNFSRAVKGFYKYIESKRK